MAIKSGNIEECKRILKNKPTVIDSIDKRHRWKSVIHVAVESNN